VSFLWRPQRGDLAHQLFVGKWTHGMKCGMSPSPIIETFDVIKGGAPSLRSCLKRLAINTFTFETMKEAFHCRIIITVSSAAHACLHAFSLQECLIALARVGTATIGMME
jgi:hypothetical protein